MTIETSVRISYGGKEYTVLAKMIRIDSTSYFFIRDGNSREPALGNKVLELTYDGSFSLTQFENDTRSPGIPSDLIVAIEEAILKNKKIWFL